MTSKVAHYCVVGGGISGLSTAYLISLLKPKGSYRLTLLESTPRFGGWVHSIPNPLTNAVYELGPHSARFTSASGKVLLRLAKSLNLQDSTVWLGSTTVNNRFLYFGGRIVPLSLLNSDSIFSKNLLLLLFKNMFSFRPPRKSDLSVDEFFRTRFNDEVADILVSALMRGIFAGDSRELSIRACLPQAIECEERGPNLVLGIVRRLLTRSQPTVSLPVKIDTVLPHFNQEIAKGAFAWSLHGGMQTLTDTLANTLHAQSPNITIVSNASVRRLEPCGSTCSVHWTNNSDGKGQILTDVDSVFLSCPSYCTADILADIVDRNTANRLRVEHLPWADVVVAVLEVAAESGLPALLGFGHLVPRSVDAHVLGVVYDSVALPHLDSPKGSVRYTVMIKPHSDWLDLSQSMLTSCVTTECLRVLREHLRLPNPQLIDIHVALLRNCIPQYPLHHLDNVKAARSEITAALKRKSLSHIGVHLVGFSYDGVGLPDAVNSAICAVSKELELDE